MEATTGAIDDEDDFDVDAADDDDDVADDVDVIVAADVDAPFDVAIDLANNWNVFVLMQSFFPVSDLAFSMSASTCVAVRTKRESSMSDQISSVSSPSIDNRFLFRLTVLSKGVGREVLDPGQVKGMRGRDLEK